MEVTVESKCGKFKATFEGTAQEVFEQVAEFQEVFDDNTCVGPDGTEYTNVRYVVRENEDQDKFYEKVCVDKGAQYRKLQYGCNKRGGGLFPKRKNKEGKFYGWNGWGKYNPETKEFE